MLKFETDNGVVTVTDEQIRIAHITGIETEAPAKPAVRTAGDHPDVEIVAGRRALFGVFELGDE